MAFYEAHCDNNCIGCSQNCNGACGWKKTTVMSLIDGYRQLFVDNSAPCSHCVYLNRASLSCEFPEEINKECSADPGNTKGWNTIEYIKKLNVTSPLHNRKKIDKI